MIIREICYGNGDIREWIVMQMKRYHKEKYGEDCLIYINGELYLPKYTKGA